MVYELDLFTAVQCDQELVDKVTYIYIILTGFVIRNIFLTVLVKILKQYTYKYVCVKISSQLI